jgi:hypothetical protein
MSSNSNEHPQQQYRPTRLSTTQFVDRKDKFPLPKLAEGELWDGTPPNGVVTTMTDSALAATNAVISNWPEAAVTSGKCGVHATVIWFPKHAQLFATKEPSKRRLMYKAMQNDFNLFRDSPFLASVPIFRSAMLAKWKTQYKEVEVADQWDRVKIKARLRFNRRSKR